MLFSSIIPVIRLHRFSSPSPGAFTCPVYWFSPPARSTRSPIVRYHRERGPSSPYSQRYNGQKQMTGLWWSVPSSVRVSSAPSQWPLTRLQTSPAGGRVSMSFTVTVMIHIHSHQPPVATPYPYPSSIRPSASTHSSPDCRRSVCHPNVAHGHENEGNLGAYAIKRVDAGAHLSTPWFFDLQTPRR